MSQEYVASFPCTENQNTTSNIEKPNCDNRAIHVDVSQVKPSPQCDVLEAQNHIQNNHLNPQSRNRPIETVANDVVVQTLPENRESGSIDSNDSGILTSPTTSHASSNSTTLQCHSSSILTSSENAINNESDSNKTIINSNLTTERNERVLVDSNNVKELTHTCAEMALAIYQR